MAKKTRPKCYAKLVKITPKMAEKFLSKAHVTARRLRKRQVKKYAQIMLAGNWHAVPGSVAVDVKGNLVDGRHICAAIVQAGKSLALVVYYGVSSDWGLSTTTYTKPKYKIWEEFLVRPALAKELRMAHAADGKNKNTKRVEKLLQLMRNSHKNVLHYSDTFTGDGQFRKQALIDSGTAVRVIHVERRGQRRTVFIGKKAYRH